MATTEMNCLASGGGSFETETVYLGSHVGYSGYGGYVTSDGQVVRENLPNVNPNYDLDIAHYTGGAESVYPPHTFGFTVIAKKKCEVTAISSINDDINTQVIEIATLNAGETRIFKGGNTDNWGFATNDNANLKLVVTSY